MPKLIQGGFQARHSTFCFEAGTFFFFFVGGEAHTTNYQPYKGLKITLQVTIPPGFLAAACCLVRHEKWVESTMAEVTKLYLFDKLTR